MNNFSLGLNQGNMTCSACSFQEIVSLFLGLSLKSDLSQVETQMLKIITS